jgi:hypothetical protein
VSYTITLRNKQVYTLSDQKAESLKELWATSKQSFVMELNGDTYKSSEIVSITKNKPTEADIPNFDNPPLPQGKMCRGEYSIQKEINNIARHDHPNDWPKYIKNKHWREQMRLQLREMTDE